MKNTMKQRLLTLHSSLSSLAQSTYPFNNYHIGTNIAFFSWGADWGESGYIRMTKDASNQCGIANTAVYPQV